MQKKPDFVRIPNGSRRLYALLRMSLMGLWALMWACTGMGDSHGEEGGEAKYTRTDDLGTQLSLSSLPQRIISTAPNITEMVYALRGQDQLIARSQACDYPPTVSSLPVVQTYPAVDWEQLSMLDPNLVLATDELFSPDILAMLTERDIPIFVQSYQNFGDIYDGLQDLGYWLNRPSRAGFLVDSLKGEVNQVLQKNALSDTEPRAAIWISGDPLVVIGGAGFLYDLMLLAGCANVFEAYEQNYVTITFEELLYQDPELIFFAAKDTTAIDRIVKALPQSEALTAIKSGHTYLLDPDELYRPGPRTISALKQMAAFREAYENRNTK